MMLILQVFHRNRRCGLLSRPAQQSLRVVALALTGLALISQGLVSAQQPQTHLVTLRGRVG